MAKLQMGLLATGDWQDAKWIGYNQPFFMFVRSGESCKPFLAVFGYPNIGGIQVTELVTEQLDLFWFTFDGFKRKSHLKRVL